MTEQVMQTESESADALNQVPIHCRNSSVLGNEDGIVLIIVLITLVLLSLLGTSLLDSTTTELKITGNRRNNQVAFYAADAALQFAQSYGPIYLLLNGTTTVWPAPGEGHSLDSSFTDGAATLTDYNTITLPNNATAQVKVEYIGSGNIPPGYGTQEDSSMSGSSFKANYFVTTAIATEANNSSATIEAQVAKVVPQ